jgi:hypothetical protein
VNGRAMLRGKTNYLPGRDPLVTFTATAIDFQMGPPPGGTTSATVVAGQMANITLQLTPVNGSTGAVTLGCTKCAARRRM